MRVLLIALLLSGCGTYRNTIGVRDGRDGDDVYTRAEIDAINATAQCKARARTMVDVARCETVR